MRGEARASAGRGKSSEVARPHVLRSRLGCQTALDVSRRCLTTERSSDRGITNRHEKWQWSRLTAGPFGATALAAARAVSLEMSSRSRVLCLTTILWSSERKHVGDAWAHEGDEGRGKLR